MSPKFLNDYLDYLRIIRNLSDSTIREYSYELHRFFRYYKARKDGLDLDGLLEDFKREKKQDPLLTIDISGINEDELKSITVNDIYSYLSYIDRIHPLSAYTRARKISCFRTFFKYLADTVDLIPYNITERLESPKIPKRNPVYLTLDEVKRLLETIGQTKNEEFRVRNMSIVMLFLTTGMRLSELVSIDLKDIRENEIRIIGKGNKERVVYVPDNCLYLINSYISIRPKVENEEALFLSMRKSRMKQRSVQHMIEKYLRNSGLDPRVYSTHKLRHTAATLMHKYGEVDIRTLQKILGHESVATTQIYTHVDDEEVKEGIKKNPLADIKIEIKVEEDLDSEDKED